MADLSAIIPTRDRPVLLHDCLATLMVQEPRGALREVVVVDDGSTKDLESVVRGFAGGPIEVRYVRQDPSGLNVGRNRGAQHARGDLLAYLDDDTLVDPTWASSMLEAFERWGADGVAGRIELLLEGPEPSWLSAALRGFLSELDRGPDTHWPPDDVTPWGANCAVTRDRFDELGGFAGGLDRDGASLLSNGDTDFFRRLRVSGGRILYAGSARVRHRVPPERLTLEWFVRRAYAQGVSDVLGGGAAVRQAREWVRATRAVPIAMLGTLRGRGAVHARVWWHYCRGRRAAGRDAVGAARVA